MTSASRNLASTLPPFRKVMLRFAPSASTSVRLLAKWIEPAHRQSRHISILTRRAALSTPIPRHISPITVPHRWTSQATAKQCPSCSTPLPTALPICPNCSYIHSVSPEQSYHELFGLSYEPNPFNVDTSALRRQFILAQGVVHPDKWSGKPKAQQDTAAQISTYVNHAYGTLGDPVKRAFYILRREGIPDVSESEQSLEDPTLITDIMELRESIESAESQEVVDSIRDANKMQMGNLEDEISTLIAAKDWVGAKNATIKLKYYQGIELAAKVWPNTAHDH